MKRSEFVLRIQDQLDYVCNVSAFGYVSNNTAEKFVQFLEELGIQPPLSTPKIIPDPTRKGTVMHTESKREWDNE